MPFLLRKTASLLRAQTRPGVRRRASSHALRAASDCGPNMARRSRLPLPRTVARALSRSTSSRFRPTSSLTRSPAEYSVSRMARSRRPRLVASGRCFEQLSSWPSPPRKCGSFLSCRGVRSPSVGLLSTSPCRLRKRNHDRTAACRRAMVGLGITLIVQPAGVGAQVPGRHLAGLGRGIAESLAAEE